MYQIVIADRDQQEAEGLQWLIKNNAFPVHTISTCHTLSSFVDLVETQIPDIVCIELDMIPADKWEVIRPFIQRVSQVIVITAEPTFQKAMQALELEAINLWMKPLSLSMIRHDMQSAFRKLSNQNDVEERTVSYVDYESLFIKSDEAFSYPVFLLEVEDLKDLPHLRSFVKQYPFSVRPQVLSTSDRIVLVFGSHFHDEVERARTLLYEWSYVSHTPMAIGVHTRQQDQSLQEIYIDLIQAMELTFFTGYNQVFETKDVGTWRDFDPFLSVKEQNEWIDMLSEGDRHRIRRWLRTEFFAFTSPYPEPGLLRTRLTSILAQVRRYMLKSQMTDDKYEKHYKSTFDHILYGSNLFRIVQEMILFIVRLVETVNNTPVSHRDAVDHALAFIRKEYRNKTLTLSQVADQVQLSSAYVSDLLSKQYGRSFSEIVLNYRITYAKEKLLSTDLSISEIAEAAGFHQANYFSRVFKENIGKTPREFRKTT
ncbi:DNA-binding response regulator, AraC family [Geomicrobium sp. JCM 19037]|uniref:response regulator transcription factor n=1 Tax=unclassified Geomicrobium TaxID=2628951 RepID=UPI00045F17B5|nr:response regulator transcription factor [Geomicrobium sp. JCM 19037]GAK05149.1 DNA-binding response regulator, AraC family [Geomicrobium sp. JCM 19037]